MSLKSNNAPGALSSCRALNWKTVFAALVLFEFATLLVALLIPQRAADLHAAYGQLLIAALAGVYFTAAGLPRKAELRIFLLWMVWLLLSRWLSRDFYLFIDRPALIASLRAFLFLAVGTVLDARQRQRFLRALTIVYAGFFVLAAAAGLFVVLTGTFLHIPPENTWITLFPSNHFGLKMRALNLFSVHRLSTAPRLFLAWCLLLLQIPRVRKKLWVLPLCLGMLILHLDISLCYSRSVQICFSVACAMLALLVVYRRLRLDGVKRLLVLALVPLVCLPLAYKSFDLCTGVVAKLRAGIVPRYEQFYRSSGRQFDPEGLFGLEADVPDETETEDPQAQAAASGAASSQTRSDETPEDAFTDQRRLAGNVTLTGRTDIWKSIIPSVREKPSILFYGQPSKEIMPLANKYIPSREYKAYMHNLIAQTFMLTGLPGTLLVLAWCVLLLIKLVRAFFRRAQDVPITYAILTIPLACVFLYDMVEVIVFTNFDVCGYVFLLLAGLFLAEYEELSPRGAKKAED